MQAITSLGPKGITFLVCCVLDIIMGILCCFGQAFGIVVGLVAMILGLIGGYSSYARNLRGLFIVSFVLPIFGFLSLAPMVQFLPLLDQYFWIALSLCLTCIILLLVLFLGYHTLNDVPYVGACVLIPLCLISAYLAYDGRGKSLAWTVVGGSAAPSATAA